MFSRNLAGAKGPTTHLTKALQLPPSRPSSRNQIFAAAREGLNTIGIASTTAVRAMSSGERTLEIGLSMDASLFRRTRKGCGLVNQIAYLLALTTCGKPRSTSRDPPLADTALSFSDA